MIITYMAEAFDQSPLGATLIGVACTTMVIAVAAMLKMVVQLTRLEGAVKDIQKDVTEIKTDADVMRWSNYGRAMSATGQAFPKGGGN